MIRRLLRVTAALVLTAGLLATTAAAASTPTLGLSSTTRTGFGQVKPRTVSYHGDGTSFVDDISWSSWGGAQATGSGKAAWVWPGLCNACGAELLKATIVAYDPGTCKGHYIYEMVAWYFPSRGQTFSKYLGGTNLCTGRFDNPPKYLIDPVSCGNDGSARELTATDLSCSAARAHVSTFGATRYRGHNNARWRVGSYYCGLQRGIGVDAVSCQSGDFKTVGFVLG